MSTAHDILRSYRAPRAVLRERLGRGVTEASSLATLMAACLLIFAGQGPRLSRQAFLEEGLTLEALLAGALFGWLFVAPLAFYVIALVVYWLMRVLGAQVTPGEVRYAIFWGLLAATPAILLNGLVAGFIGAGTALALTGAVALAAVIGFWVSGLIEISRSEVPA